MSSTIPKAVLYYSPASVGSSAAILALEEKGYGENEVELRIVEINKGEHWALTFLRLNPKGTVPTLVVPLESTLAPEAEHRYKAITDSKSVLEFLDKSRSTISRTHTTSLAPAPSLTPATIALSSLSNNIITLLLSDEADPDTLLYHNALDDQALRTVAGVLLPTLHSQREALVRFITESQQAEIQASEKTRNLWEGKLAEVDKLLAVYGKADVEANALSPEDRSNRESFIQVAKDLWHHKLRKVLHALDRDVIGPFALGDQLSLVDLHLAPWLARLALLTGGTPTDDGNAIVTKLETRLGHHFSFPKDFQLLVAPDLSNDPSLAISPGEKKAKLAAFWDELRVRPSWSRVYADALH